MTIAVHDLLRTRDCLEYGCTNDAGPDGVCVEHVMYRTARTSALALRAVELREAGASILEIAEELGVARSTAAALYGDPTGSRERARKDGYRRPCPNCGTLMSGCDGLSVQPKMCRDCANQAQHDNQLWPRERVIEAIQAFDRIVGRPPLSSEWLYRQMREQLPDPPAGFHTWPWTNTVLERFGSWANGIEAAGFPRPQIGHKVNPPTPDRRHSPMPLKSTYIVFTRGEDGLHELGRSLASDPQHALEDVVAAGNGGGDEFWVISERQFGASYRLESRPVFVRQPRAAA